MKIYRYKILSKRFSTVRYAGIIFIFFITKQHKRIDLNYTLSADIVGLSIAITFLIVFTISKNRSNRARYILIAGMVTAIVLYLLNLFVIIEFWLIAKYLFFIALPLLFALYPILNVYINTFVATGKEIIIDPKTFILPVLVCISLIVVLLNLDEPETISLISAINAYKAKLPDKLEVFFWILYAAYYGQFFYFLKKFVTIYRLLKNVKKYFFASRWIKYIITGIIVYEITFFLSWYFKNDVLFLDAVLSDLVILFTGILGLKHDEILLEMQISQSLRNNPVTKTFRKIKSKLDPGFQEKIINEMKKMIQEEKLYLNPNLKIKNFAKRLHIPERELSIIINENIGKNFSNFINQFRIEEACNLLSDKEIKISDIPLQVGFFSRSAFNNTFKEFTGKTPTEYRLSI